MIIFYSGNPTGNCELLNKPEDINNSIMLTFALQTKQVSKRFRKYYKMRKKKIGIIESHFLDSGAFSQWTKAQEYAKQVGRGRWAYFFTKEFWDYVDAYAEFVKKYKIAIDLYANVDVIGSPQLTWRNQKYLETKHNLHPVPVVHYKTDLKWLEKYMKKGYEIIGLGGLVGSTAKAACRHWLDNCFNIVCDTPNRMPKVKIHGFGVTSYKFLTRYPWWSVDSAAWDKIASYGGICVPHKRQGEFVFDIPPYIMKVSKESPHASTKSHLLTISTQEKTIIQEWLDFIKIPMGEIDKKGDEITEGVVTFHVYRRIANLVFYDMMVKSLPKWPWPFGVRRKTLL